MSGKKIGSSLIASHGTSIVRAAPDHAVPFLTRPKHFVVSPWCFSRNNLGSSADFIAGSEDFTTITPESCFTVVFLTKQIPAQQNFFP
jgi:hypothetical protein